MSRQKRDKSTATTTSDRNHPEKPNVTKITAIAGGIDSGNTGNHNEIVVSIKENEN